MDPNVDIGVRDLDLGTRALNWLLLVICVVIVIVVSFFLFYWNRLVGWILALTLRTLFWKKNNVWIECDAVQFSFLAGRILIKDLRYHSTNESIRILNCNITWRYWLWRTRGEDDMKRARVGGEDIDRHAKSQQLPCRVQIYAEGVEWFLYNRSSAYDEILKHFKSHGEGTVFSDAESPHFKFSSEGKGSTQPSRGANISSEDGPSIHTYPPVPLSRTRSTLAYITSPVKRARSWLSAHLPKMTDHDLLPIGFEIVTGAIVLGNDSTPSVLIASFESAKGTYGIAPSRSIFDLYKQIYAFKFINAKIITRTNTDYRGTMVDQGRGLWEELREKASQETSLPYFTFLASRPFRHLAQFLTATLRLSEQLPPASANWHGLPRFLTHEEKVKSELTREHEYAKISTLLETGLLELGYFSDVAGKVPPNARTMGPVGIETIDIGNGDLSPEWGIDLVIHGGTINYGPWADRQRVALQKLFFPNTHNPRTPTARLKSGQMRVHTALTIYVEFMADCILRTPVREASKNWRYDGLGDLDPSKRSSRPYGWFDIRVGRHSTINYVMSMVANETGYENNLEMHFERIGISSSVNQNEFFAADGCRISCDMPSPLQWNAERQWTIDTAFTRPIIHLLRDHVTLITDLVKDWTSGPPSDFALFVPTTYVLKMGIKDFEVYLYVNDHNVIDFPLSHEHNALLRQAGPSLQSEIYIPSNKFRPESTMVSFSVEAPNSTLSLTLPAWDTHALFATDRTQHLGSVGLMRLNGSYLFYSDVREDEVDKLKLDINARNVAFKSFGFAIRHLMIVRDNYFGSFTNFTTREEYLDKKLQNAIGDPVELKYRKGKSNVFETLVTVHVQDGLVVEPQELYDCQAGVLVSVPEVQLYLRLHDFYMEMALNIPPVCISATDDCATAFATGVAPPPKQSSLMVNGIEIIGHRLFGPQPRTSTYLCLWEVQVGAITGALTPSLTSALEASSRSLRLNFADVANAPSSDFQLTLDPDVTFVKIGVTAVDIAWRTPLQAVQISLPHGLLFDSNDHAGKSYRNVKSVVLPTCRIRCLLASSEQPKGQLWTEVASFSFDVRFDQYGAPLGWRNSARAQKRFVLSQDALTGRARFLYDTVDTKTSPPGHHMHSLFLPLPKGPKPPNPLPSRNDDIDSHSSDDVSFVSDDDGELSEAGRNAKVSELRQSSLASERGAHRSGSSTESPISSGDESDDTDTNADALSESDGSGGTFQRDKNSQHWLPLQPYRHVLRQFRSAAHSFVMDQDIPQMARDGIKLSDSTRPESAPAQQHSPSSATDKIDNDLYAVATFSVLSKSPWDVCLSPLFATFGAGILEALDTDSKQTSLEKRLDALLSTFISSRLPAQNPRKLVIDLRITTIRVRSWQDIMSVEESEYFHTGDRSKILSNSSAARLLSLVHFEARGLDLAAIHTTGINDNLNLTVTFQQLHTDVCMIASQRKPMSRVVDLRMGQSSFTFAKDKSGVILRPTIGDATVTFSISCPEILLGTARAGTAVAQALSAIRLKYEDKDLSRTRLMVWTILNRNGSIDTDPLSRIQPSFMVRSGLPEELRSDYSWKLLTNIRHRLRGMSEEEQSGLFKQLFVIEQAPPVSLDDDIIPLVMEHRGEWAYELEESEIPNLPLVKLLFPNGTASPTATHVVSAPPRTVVRLSVGRLSSILQSGEEQQNQLDIFPFNCTLRSAVRQTSDISLPVFPLDSSIADEATITHHIVTASFGGWKLTIFPTAIPFARRVLMSQKRFLAVSPPPITGPGPIASKDPTRPRAVLSEVFVTVRELGMTAAAQNLLFDARMSHISASSSIIVRPKSVEFKPVVVGGAFTMKEMSLRARTTKTGPSDHMDRDVLAGIVLSQSTCTVGWSNRKLRGTIALQSLKLSVPRSAIRLYRFIREWRKEYLPAYESLVQDLLSEIQSTPKSVNGDGLLSPDTPIVPFDHLDVQASLGVIGVSLHVMHGTWLSWDLLNCVAFVRNKPTNRGQLSCGLQLASQIIRLSTKLNPQEAAESAVKIALPSFRASGDYGNSRAVASVIVDLFTLTLKPHYMDDILVVQQKFGSDFNDLVDLFGANRSRPSSAVLAKPPRPLHPFRYDVSVQLQGFTIGIEGPTSIQYLESSVVQASFRNSDSTNLLLWEVTVVNLALSLAHRSLNISTNFDRASRIAYTVLDLSVDNKAVSTQGGEEHLNIRVSKVHAMMMPAAIGELGDLIDHVQAEMLLRKEQRSLELEEIKKKTQRVMKTLERPSPSADRRSWLDRRIIALDVNSIGVAFPLSTQDDLFFSGGTRHPGSTNSSSIPAFLFSIHHVEFRTQRYETGNARITDFAFQFVSRFDQSVPAHFDGSSHGTLNRMIYPSMTAELHTDTSPTSRRVQVHALVSGFILDLDPTFPTYVFSLVDVYRQGKESFGKLAPLLPKEEPVAQVSSQKMSRSSSADAKYTALPTSSLRFSLEFRSGKVRLHPPEHALSTEGVQSRDMMRSKSLPIFVSEASTYEAGDSSFQFADAFDLPRLSVWVEYRATPASHKVANHPQSEPSALSVSATIHSSRNVLRPTLLPFITELSRTIETRMRRTEIQSTKKGGSRLAASTATLDTSSSNIDLYAPAMNSLQMSFSLRIDQSTLELTCLPDANVVAGLHWKSGGFLVNVNPGAREILLVGTVESVTAGLKHGYLIEDCVNAHAQNLNFTVGFPRNQSSILNSISVVIDTEVEAGVRFGRLQDILCFKAVWLDRIPIIETASTPATLPGSPISTVSTLHADDDLPEKQHPFLTMVLVRVRRLNLEMDLGQPITKITLDLTPVVVRTRLTEQLSELSLSIGLVDLRGVRTLSGHLRMPDFMFQTIRRRRVRNESGAKMLELAIKSGPLEVSVEFEMKNILLLRADPLDITVFDDWTQVAPDSPLGDRQVQLHFDVSGGDVLAAARIMTIPELILMGYKVRSLIKSQREGAARESAAYSSSRTPKPSNPLSQVATAMLQSAKSKLKDTETAVVQFMVVQHMHLQIGRIRLGVFAQGDGRMTQFEALVVEGWLKRNVQSEGHPPFRDLHLALQSFEVRGGDTPIPTKWLDLLNGAKIFTMPEMKIAMQSTERHNPSTGSTELEYIFSSKFPPKSRNYHSLYIALDFHKFEQLLAMQNSLRLEIEKALAEVEYLEKNTAQPRGPTVLNPKEKVGESVVMGVGLSVDEDAQAGPSQPPGLNTTGVAEDDTSIPPLSASSISTTKTTLSAFQQRRSAQLNYKCVDQHIDTPKLHALGAASPDLETFKQWTNINIQEEMPKWIHEYATVPIEQIMKVLLEVYVKQLKAGEREADAEAVGAAKMEGEEEHDEA